MDSGFIRGSGEQASGWWCLLLRKRTRRAGRAGGAGPGLLRGEALRPKAGLALRPGPPLPLRPHRHTRARAVGTGRLCGQAASRALGSSAGQGGARSPLPAHPLRLPHLPPGCGSPVWLPLSHPLPPPQLPALVPGPAEGQHRIRHLHPACRRGRERPCSSGPCPCL